MAAKYPWSSVVGGSYPWEKNSSGGGGKGVGGFLGNLGSDAGQAVLGIVPGAVEAVRNPVKTGKAIGRSYQDTYGMLNKPVGQVSRRDLDKFLDGVYEHPLGPLLDLATVVTLGGAGASKAGTAPSIALRSPRALARDGKITDSNAVRAAQDLKVKGVKDQPDVLQGKRLSRNPVIQKRQQLVDAMLKKLPPDTRAVGEFARYGKELSRLNRRDSLRLERSLIPYRKAYQALSKHERAAFDVMIRYPLPRLLDAQIQKWKAGDEVSGAFAEAVSSPKVRALYDAPTPAMLKLRDEADTAGKTMARVLRLPEETLSTRPFLHMRLASGGKFEYDEAALGKRGLTRELVAQAEGAEGVAAGAFVRAADRDNYGRVLSVNGDTANVHFVNRFDGTEAKVDLPVSALTPVSSRQVLSEVPKALEGGDAPDTLQAELASSGRPFPIYDPDTAAIAPSPFSFQRSAGGGKARPRKIGETKQSQGVLAQLGQLALGMDTLSPAFMRSLRYGLYTDLYEGLLAAAVRVPRQGATLKAGYEWVRAPKGRTSSESIPYTTKTRADALDNLDDFAPDDDASYRDGFTSKSLDDALDDNGFYLQVPSTLARSVVGEFTRSGPVLNYLIEKPTRVWRTLVLNLRPAWLVNNIVGNHLLLAFRYFGPRFLESYARSMKDIGKDDASFRKLVEEYFPEQAGGTFIDTQLPQGGKVGKVAKVLGGGLAPADRAVEGALRRTAIRQELRKNPQVKARLKQMRGEKQAFEKAARLELDADPQLAREVSDQVNSVLGDFLGLSPFERTYVRSVAPFYAWYRAITLIALKLPLDHPGRTNLLVKLGEVGAEDQDKDYPLNLQGLIAGEVGQDGRQRVLDTSRANPLTTITGVLGDVGGVINPLVEAPARAAFGDSKYDQVTAGRFLGGASRGVGGTFYDDIPQARLLEALGVNLPGVELKKGPGTLYDRSAREELLRFLGVAGGRINPNRAKEIERDRR